MYFARTQLELRVPYDLDLYRDAAQAGSVRNGKPLGDWAYRSEATWYNPLGSWVVAMISWLTGSSVTRVVTGGGVFLNLVTPIAFAALVRRWFGRITAGFALVGYLFVLCANFPPWAVATYSPWLFQSIPAQGLFFAALLILPAALEKARWRERVVLGVVFGLTVLAHTAPAVLLALMLVTATIRVSRRKLISRRTAALRLMFIYGVAVVISAPFWLPLAWQYRFRVVNSRPTDFVWSRVEPGALAGLVWDYLVRWPVAVAATGLVLAWLSRRSRNVRLDSTWVLIHWTALSGALLVLSVIASSSMPGAGLIPHVVPAHHFVLYLSAAACVWFGLGMCGLAHYIAGRLRNRSAAIVAVALAVVAVIPALPGWRLRDDRLGASETSRYIDATFNDFATSRWIESATPSDSIVLYDVKDDPGVMANALDGRRTVVIDNPYFSSPYVRWEPRFGDARAMITALSNCDAETFDSINKRYDVDYVVADEASALHALDGNCSALSLVHEDPFADVFEIASPSTGD